MFEKIQTKEELTKSVELIKETYNRVKLPIPDQSLFLSTFGVMNSKNMVKFFKVTFNNKIIGVRFVYCYNKLVYDWYAGSSTVDIDKYPNDFMPFKIMQWGRDNGYKTFQFGGAGKPDKPYGVRDYKLKFGGELVNWGRFEMVHKPVLMKMGMFAFRLYKRIK